ncbi:MAG: UvrD-helicase domain-containing protein [Patescibacteria group bacterium]
MAHTALLGLNDRQKEAVSTTEGPLLILAGAGAGKTKTLTHRILHLVQKGIEPRKILAITFTNKAAKEMRERVEHLISSDGTLNLPISFNERPFTSTFHSLGVHIIRQHGNLIGIPRSFSILDRTDSRRIVREALEELKLDPKEHKPDSILNMISREKGNYVTQASFQNRTLSPFEEIVSECWKRYEAALIKEKSLDFDDLLLKTAQLLVTNQEVREYYWNIWQYIHIDEYQDTNKVQYVIATTLAEKSKNICAVGDIDQTIYSWRGADIRNILNFEKDYPEAKVILLEENYRSTQTILTAANSVIKKNKMRKEKNLFTRNEDGEKIKLEILYNEVEEARSVGQNIRDLIDGGSSPSQIAVLYRANFQSRVLEDAMIRENIPYQLLGVKFFERKEVKDVLSYIRAALNPDSASDITRVINTPTRGIGKTTLIKVLANMRDTLPAATKNKVDTFYSILDEIRARCSTETPSETVRWVLRLSGMEAALKAGGSEDEERLENVREIVSLAATKYDHLPPMEGIEALLTDAALASDQDEMEEKKDAVRLMTVHASKGLEFDNVCIVGMEEDLFPYSRMDEKRDQNGDEEERRLFYVALTRARKRLYLTCSQIRTIFGSPKVNTVSQFINDINSNLIESTEQEEPRGVKAIFIDF